MPNRQPLPEQSGAALLLVFWVLILLSTIAVTVTALVLQSSRDAVLHGDLLRERVLEEGGIEWAISALLDPEPAHRPPVGDTLITHKIGERPVYIGIEDEAGKLDVNTASLTDLRRIFETTGAETAQVERWSESLQSYRSGVNAELVRFTDLDTVAADLDIPRDIMACLRRDLTVYTGFSQPDLTQASSHLREVLNAQGLTKQQTSAPSGNGENSASGRIVSVTSRVDDTSTGDAQSLSAIVRITGSPVMPYLIMDVFDTYSNQGAAESCSSHRASFR